MWNYLRRKLGISDLYDQYHGIRGSINRLNADSEHQNNQLRILSTQLGAIAPGLGRVIAKLDPLYGKDELDPERKKASEDLGDEVMKKLLGEHKAREPYS